MVSRQRVEAELIKILRGKKTFSAFQLMHDLHLYNPVFFVTLPCIEDETPSWVLWHWEWYGPRHAEWARAFETVALLLSGGPETLRNILLQPEKMEDIWMLTAFVPMDIGQLHDLAEREVKFPEFVSQAMRNYHRILHYMREGTADGSFTENLPRGTLGLLIRTCGSTWRLQELFALLKDDVDQLRYGSEKMAWLKQWSRFVEYISAEKLENAPYVKPILDEHDILALYNLEKGGPFMQQALDDLLVWQFTHENAAKEDAMEWMLTQRDMYNV